MANYRTGNLELQVKVYSDAAAASLSKMNNQLDKTQKTLKNVGITATLGKINYTINMIRYYGRAVSNLVQYGMDYVETLNLWQVANRGNIALADEFITKMTKAYGISEQTLMNYQAIFKNMLSALGDISDMASSQLSMQLTQLAIDFSSLYNVSIERAMTVYQSILSGQVRPVRSISGMDITENTIFALYQRAGGTKTMRQLSQVEKRLLRIVAVFDQMGESGAIGDMAKTIESAANQSRVMGEQFKEILTWSGQIILLWLNNAGVLTKVNAVLITIKELTKAIAYDLGYEEADFLSGMITETESATEAVEELQGKLLSFDKFNALNTSENNVLGVDPTIENLISKINLEMGKFKMQAQETAKEWLAMIGLVDEDGDGIYEINGDLKGTLILIKDILASVIVILALGLTKKLFVFVTGIKSLTGALNMLLAVGILTALFNMIDAFKEGNYAAGLLAGTISISLIAAFVALNKKIIISQWLTLVSVFKKLATTISVNVFSAIQVLRLEWEMLNFTMKVTTGLGILAFLSGVISLFKEWGNMTEAGKIISILVSITAGVVALAVALKALKGNWAGALGIAGLVAGSSLLVTTNLKSLKAYANGGYPEEGQLFIAREAGAEMVGSMGGRTAVANNDQIVEGISQGVYEATIRANAQVSGRKGKDIVLKIDGRELARANVGNTANALSDNYRIEFKPR